MDVLVWLCLPREATRRLHLQSDTNETNGDYMDMVVMNSENRHHIYLWINWLSNAAGPPNILAKHLVSSPFLSIFATYIYRKNIWFNTGTTDFETSFMSKIIIVTINSEGMASHC